MVYCVLGKVKEEKERKRRKKQRRLLGWR